MAGRKAKRKRKAQRSWGERLRRLGRAVLLWTLLGIGLAVGAFGAWIAWSWPDVDAVAEGPVRTSAFIEAFAAETNRRPKVRWRALEQIDEDLALAVLVAEDARFFEHGAFDPRELAEALEDRLVHDRRLRGASTLTQQLAKNLWLTGRRSLVRKLREALYAVALERRVSKHRILELYLNVVEMGPGVFGAEAAAQRFFGASAADLEPEQAALLAATLSRPSRWYPGVESEAYQRRVQHILREMERSPGVRAAIERRGE